MIDLEVLGGIDLRLAGGAPASKVLAQPKRLALLAFLAADPERPFHTRESLFALFWPESDADRARAALSQALYFLRGALGDGAIRTQGADRVGVDPAQLRCDLAELHTARKAGDPERVLALYRGALMEGCHLVDSAAWESWLAREGVRAREAAAGAAWALAERALEAGRAERARRLAARALELSEDDERMLRRVLSLLHALGDHAGVERTYRDCAERLERELGIDVSPETRALRDRLLAAGPVTARPMTASDAPPPSNPGDPGEPPGRSPPPGGAGARKTWRPWSFALLFAAVVSATLFFAGRDGGPDRSAPVAQVVHLDLLPFEDEGATGPDNALAVGLRQELASRLSNLDALRVRLQDDPGVPAQGARLSGRIVAVNEGLGVDLVLDRSAMSHGAPVSELRIDLEDALSASATAADWAASQLLPALGAQGRKLLRRGVTTHEAAFEHYLVGRHDLSIGSAEAFADARRQFEAALAIDPRFARAWSGLSDAFVGLSWTHALADDVAAPRARAAAERALEFDPALAEGHASLAQILNRYYWDSPGAERHFREAIRLQPNNADARLRYSALLRNLGQPGPARVEAEAALALDPLTFDVHRELVILDLMEGRVNDATSRARQLVELDPEIPMGRFLLARCLVESGDFDQALAQLDALGPMAGRPPALTLRGYVMGLDGRPLEAERVLAEFERHAEKEPGASLDFDFAVVFVGMGRRSDAVAALERAAEARDYRVRLLGQEPMFADLRNEPGYRSLLEFVGLSPVD